MKYQPIRLRAGHYAVISDDGRTLYGVRSYDETGDATYGDTDRKVLGRFWDVVQLSRGEDRHCLTRNPDGTIAAADTVALAAADWDALSSMNRTKRDALAELDAYLKREAAEARRQARQKPSPDPATLVRESPRHRGHVQVRLTPADRDRAYEVLRRRLGRKYVGRNPTTGERHSFRGYETHETTLMDCVRYGPRGWSIAMRPDTAAEIAGKLTRSEAADIGRRFTAAAALTPKDRR